MGTSAQALGYLINQQTNAVISSLAVTLTLVSARLAVRNKTLAVVFTWLVVSLMMLGGENYAVTIPLALASGLLLTVVLVRFSILAYGTTVFIMSALQNFPLTLDFSRWYAGRSMMVIFVVLALAVYGFHCALGKKSVLEDLLAGNGTGVEIEMDCFRSPTSPPCVLICLKTCSSSTSQIEFSPYHYRGGTLGNWVGGMMHGRIHECSPICRTCHSIVRSCRKHPVVPQLFFRANSSQGQ